MKILIVDDEMMIKEWLKYTISTLPFDISLLDMASNGIEALEKVEIQHYDLIFIDITMPKMNGIELLKRIYEQATDSMLIVLSSHDEFQFAKEAIKYNIKEYVLKNECSKEKLSEILNTCREKMQNQQMDSDLSQEFMERILSGNIPEKGSALINKSFTRLAGRIFFVAAVRIQGQNIKKKYENPRFHLYFEGQIGRNEELSFLLFTIESRDKGNTYNFNYAELLSGLMNRKVSCGKLCRDQEEVLPECRNSWIGYQNLFYSGEMFCSGSHQFMDFDTDSVDTLCDTAISDIRSYMKEKTLRNLAEINQFFLKNRPTDVEGVINIYLALLDTFFIYNNIKSRNITKRLNAVRSTINSFEDFNKLSAWVSQIVESSTDLIDRVKYSPAVEKALEYMELHYQTISSVLEIAEHVNLSLDYFSRLFKKEVGDTLNSYLINFRLDKASIILISSNLTIQEVAERVGIENGSYFSKCFKKKFHTQPIQFRVQTKHTDE